MAEKGVYTEGVLFCRSCGQDVALGHLLRDAKTVFILKKKYKKEVVSKVIELLVIELF
jgi:hypothetical protein